MSCRHITFARPCARSPGARRFASDERPRFRHGGGIRRLGFPLIALLAALVAAPAGAGDNNKKPSWLNQTEWNFLASQKKIVLAPDPDFAPIEWIDADGVYKGLAADYVRIVEKKLGIDFEVVNLNAWDAVLDAAQNKQVDLLPAAADTAARRSYLLFSTPHLVLPGVIIVRAQVQGVLSLADFKGKRVAVVKDYVWHEHLARDHKDIHLAPVENLKVGLKMVSLGEADAIVATLPVAIHYIEESGISNLRVAAETGYFTRLSFATRIDWPLLSSVIEKTLAQISSEERSALQRKWMGLRADQKPIWESEQFKQVATIVGALGVLLVAGGAASNLLLRRAVRARTAELRASEQRLTDFAEASSDWLWEMDADLAFTFISPKFQDITGIDLPSLIGKQRRDVIVDVIGQVSADEHMETLRRREPFRDFRYETRNKEGRATYLSISGRPVFAADGTFVGYRGTGADLTREFALRSALAKAEEHVRQTQKMDAIGQLTGGIAHDFNNILNIIGGNIELATRRVGNDGKLQKHLDSALRGVERCANLTRQLLAFARRQPLEPRVVDVNALIARMGEMLGRTVGENIRLDTILADDLAYGIFDASQLEHAILNLVVNARDAMPNGGRVAIETRNIELDAEDCARNPEAIPGRYVKIIVSDDGMGISADVLARVFEPFFTTKDVGKGTGLGLAMVYGFVKQSGGHVTMDSAVGRGTTVALYLPRAPAGAAVETVVENRDSDAQGGTGTILVVEDNDDLREFVTTVLKSLGYDVHAAADGPAAVRLAATLAGLDALLTDVVLPGGMNGPEVAAAIGKMHPAAGLLYMSGYSENAITGRGGLVPEAPLLDKPFTVAEMLRAIQAALARAG